jgi:hypothetical protein
LLGKPLVKGDIVVIGGAQRRRDMMGRRFRRFFLREEFSEIFNQMGFGEEFGRSHAVKVFRCFNPT